MKNRRISLVLSFALPVAFLLASGNVAAQIRVTTVTSSADGGTLTITGSAFGTKAQAAPIKWDNFEGGNLGQDVANGWYVESVAVNPKYANDVLRPGSTRSVKQDFTTSAQYNATVGLTGLSNSRLYVSFWKSTTIGGSGPSRNYKIISFRGGPPGAWDLPNGRHDIYPISSGGHIYTTDCDGGVLSGANTWTGAYDLTQGRWQRFEYFIDQGTPNVADGNYFWWLDGQLKSSLRNYVSHTAACPFTNVYVNSYFATDQNGAASMSWLDDVYVDSTQARVEVCDASTWGARTHCELQIPRTWSGSGTPNSITVTVNRGSFGDSGYARAYLYVVDANGNASAGFPLSGVLPGGVRPPGAPGAVRLYVR